MLPPRYRIVGVSWGVSWVRGVKSTSTFARLIHMGLLIRSIRAELRLIRIYHFFTVDVIGKPLVFTLFLLLAFLSSLFLFTLVESFYLLWSC